MSDTQPCPCCKALSLVELCHLPPDPRYFCEACGAEFDHALQAIGEGA